MPDRSLCGAGWRRSIRGLAGAALFAVVGPGAAGGQTAQAPEPAAAEEEATEPAPAATRAVPPSDVEVIRIKGRAVTGIETEVPASVTQFSAADLQALGAQNVSDLAKVTPNVEIKTTGSTAPTFFIRGVGLSDFSANAAGAVAIYRDDVAINGPAIQLTPLFDLENVEVLRGPQSTGSGRNASAGAIKIYSRKPTGDLSAELISSFGNYDFKEFQGAIEAPLAAEVLATRLAFRWTERGPIGTNRCGGKLDAGPPPPGVPTISVCGETDQLRMPFLPDEVNDAGNWSARGQLRFQPQGLDMDWILNLHGTRVDQLSTLGQAMGTANNSLGSTTATGYQDPDALEEFVDLGGPPNSTPGATSPAGNQLGQNLARNLDIRPFSGNYNRVGDTVLDTWGASLRGDWTLGPVTLTSISGFETYDRSRDTDQDFTPDALFENISEDDAWQLFQELKAAGELPDYPLRWDVGAYYLMEDLHYEDRTLVERGLAGVDRDYTQDLKSYGVYAGFGWDFLDDFRLEGGVRWNWDRKDLDFTTWTIRISGDQDEYIRGPADPAKERLVGKAPTGTLTLTYRFNEEVSSYWKYSRGWKPGTFNTIAKTQNVAAQSTSVTLAEPETIDAWETGLRGTWLDGRLTSGAALFFYKYANYQVFVVADAFGAPPTFQIVNANDAQVYGAELDLRLEPLVDLVPPELEGLVVTARAGWLESEFLDFSTSQTRFVSNKPVDVQQDFTGNQLINSPRFKLSTAAEWTFDLGRWGAIIPRYDFAWSSDIYFDPNEGRGVKNEFGETFLPKYANGQRRYWVHNVRLGYRVPEGNIEIAGWCRNLTDEVYKTYAFDATTFAKVLINFVGEPRTYGLDLTVRF
jgi:iron complex outermembrane receptor protein